MAKIQWERIVLFLVGVVFLLFAIGAVYRENIVGASGITVIALLCFAFSNLTRFKRIKALGMEAELWEEKQQEAADLIDRLKDVVSTYTSEVIKGSVQQGRFADGQRWRKIWPLYERLIGQHAELGQKIDFSALKSEVDTYFLFDMCMNVRGYNKALFNAQSKANDVIQKEFGNVVRDADAYGKRIGELRDIVFRIDDPFAIAQHTNLAAEMLRLADETGSKLKDRFGIDLAIDEKDLARLRAISDVWENRPVKVTAELVSWADRETEA